MIILLQPLCVLVFLQPRLRSLHRASAAAAGPASGGAGRGAQRRVVQARSMSRTAYVIHHDAAGSATPTGLAGRRGRRGCCRKARGDVKGFHASICRAAEGAALGNSNKQPVRVLPGIVDFGERRALSCTGSQRQRRNGAIGPARHGSGGEDDAIKRWMVSTASVMAAHIEVAGSVCGVVGVVECAGMDLSCGRGSDGCSYDPCKARVRLNHSWISGSGRDTEESRLAGRPIRDRRIRNLAEARGYWSSETGAVTGIVPVVHAARIVARQDMVGSEVEYRAGEFATRDVGYAVSPVTGRQRRCAIEYPGDLP